VTRKLLAASLIVNVLLLGLVGMLEHRFLLREARAFWHQLLGSSATASSIEPMAAGEILVSIDVNADVHMISPYIYGVSKRDASSVAGLDATINRWGGNPSSRFNWTIGNAWNAGDDWEFRNLNYGAKSGSESDRFVAGNKAEGMASIITVPALGWVARSDRNSDQSLDVPANGGPATSPTGAIAGYDPAANRLRTSVQSLPRKPGPFVLKPDPSSPAVYQDEWVNHLVAQFGSSSHGGVEFYAIDNEPMLWSQTHRDVHPARVGYDELARVFLDYSAAVKSVDRSAQVLGPESCCWTDYWYSELDRGTDKFATHADRTAHGDAPLIPWFLRAARQHDAVTGIRSLDVLTVHYYPEASKVATDTSNRSLDALRLRSTRSLWDPTYVDGSWINEPVMLIPRLKAWVAAEYPGTPIGITEYNMGGGNSISAGLAEADVLGIFGREGIYLATYWTAPKPRSPAWFAFRMYRDADGSHDGFGDVAIRATSSSAGTVSAFASKEPGWVDVMLVNNDLQSGHDLRISLRGKSASGPVRRFQYSSANASAIERLADLTPSGTLKVAVPAASITLLRVPVTG
jgi:hypothetical protein